MNSPAALTAIESWWGELAGGIAEADGRLPLEDAELAARRAVGLAVFLWTCRRRGLLGGRRLEGLPGCGRGAGLEEAARLAEERLGRGLFELPSAGRADDAQATGLAGLGIEEGTLHAALARSAVPRAALDVLAERVESLGAIHERLLGRRLRRRKDGRVGAEKSARAKRKGGIFYTPSCVARYVVENCVERGSGGEILDPACGSGAFLLAACRRLAGGGMTGGWPAERIFGMDVDAGAVLAARRSVWLEIISARPRDDAGGVARTVAENIRAGDVLVDSVPKAWAGRFGAVVGNPPYRRELNSKVLLDRIAATDFGRRHRSPRMDLWYYFVHRSLELLQPGGRLSFIVGSYWTAGRGAEKVIAALEDQCHVEEIFLLDRLKVFGDVAGRHLIFRVRKGAERGRTTIKRAAVGVEDVARLSKTARR